MKIILPLVVGLALAPVSARALERNLSGVGSFELHGSFLVPSLDHYTYFVPGCCYDNPRATAWTLPSGGGGLSAGIGLARSVGMRLRFDLNAMRYGPNNPFMIDIGADWYASFGNPDTLLWRPFVGIAFGYSEGNDYLVPRLGLDMLVPFSRDEDAIGFLLRAAIDANLRGSADESDRVWPLVSISAGIAFDIY